MRDKTIKWIKEMNANCFWGNDFYSWRPRQWREFENITGTAVYPNRPWFAYRISGKKHFCSAGYVYTRYDEDQYFHTKEECQAFCDKLNKEIENWSEVKEEA